MLKSGYAAGDVVGGFSVVSVTELADLKAEGIYLKHQGTGLEVFHLYADDEENLFSFSFMTPPSDSTGVAHILEHSVLCGSKNYPLKDPFLVLAKQSVKTFLNAMTFPDKTCYPASSMVEADYFNLMGVYGDAVFFPLLERWVFDQEGHRFEFSADGACSIQGVVFNEMKGNYSSFDNFAGDWSLRSILRGTVYDHDSGGDPSCIPDLTYEAFKDFHGRHYNPGNCKLFLYGNIPTARQLAFVEDRFLSRFSGDAAMACPDPIAPLKPVDDPIEMRIPAPAAAGQNESAVTVLVNWLLPPASDTVALMEATLVSELLLGHDGSPLSRALLESGLGEDIAPCSGLETEVRNLCFCAGLRGVQDGKEREVATLILDTIRAAADRGFDPEEIETAVRSIDFSNREIRRSSSPFSLALMRRSLRSWIHGEGPVAGLLQISAFEEVKRRLSSDKRYVSSLLSRWLVDNGHRSLVTVFPDAEYETRIEQSSRSRVDRFVSSLDESARAQFLASQERFFAFQAKPDDEGLLSLIPHLARSDLPLAPAPIPTKADRVGSMPVMTHEETTNGISYLDVAVPVDVLAPSDYPLLPFYASSLLAVGCAGMDWATASAKSASLTGSLGSLLYTSSAVSGRERDSLFDAISLGRDYLILRVKMLEELSSEAVSLLFDFLETPDFTDSKRLGDILSEYRNDLDSSLAPAGNQYAVSRASASFTRSKAVDELWNGVSQIAFVRDLSRRFDAKGGRAELSAQLERVHARILEAGMVCNVTGTAEGIARVLEALSRRAGMRLPPAPPSPQSLDHASFLSLIEGAHAGPSLSLLTAPSLQVGFAAACLSASAYGTREHAAETVFGHWLSNGSLWEKIRTSGGAYGAFSYPDSLESTFVLATYRDPSPASSLERFREALEEAAKDGIDQATLDRNVTGSYSREIQPRSPSDRGFTAFIRLLYGIREEDRRAKLSYLVDMGASDLQRCANRLLGSWDSASQAVLAGKKAVKEARNADSCGKVAEILI